MATVGDFEPSVPLRAVMAAQRQLFSAHQARAAGYTAGEIERLRASHRIVSVRRGVYAVTADYAALAPLARHAVAAQAALMCLAGPVTLSHETAAVWTSLEMLRPTLGDVHVTRPQLQASRREAGIYHHHGAMPDLQRRHVEGAAVTSAARTAVDIARHTDFTRGLAACDSALRSGATRAELIATLEFCSSWPGARSAGRVVSHADGRAANPGESWSRAVFIEAGIPPTSLQLEVRDAAGLIGFADFGWEDGMTLGEFDGRWKYAVPPGTDAAVATRALWAEKRREDRLRAAGYSVVRWAWEDLFAPDRLVARVSAAFDRAGGRRRTA